MRLIKFRITHYKSIIDSGECSLADDMTILVGKNESGKTAILEALRDFDREQYSISESAYPLNAAKNEEPILEIVFRPSDQELAAVERTSGLTIQEDIRQVILKEGFCLEKTFLGEYKLKNSYVAQIFDGLLPEEDKKTSESADIQVSKQKLDKLLPNGPAPELILDKGPEVLQNSLKEMRVNALRQLAMMSDEKKKEDAVNLIRAIVRAINGSDQKKSEPHPKISFINSIVARLPRFVFFKDFEDTLPFEISMNAMKENQAVLDFAHIARLDLDVLSKTEDFQKRINFLNRHAATVAGNFLGYWDQNKVELIVQSNGDKLIFGVKEKEKTDFFRIEQRSMRFRWFLSFYLKVNCYKSDDIVMLIDEPGMHLHPVAQKDILKMLKEEAGGTMQIVFSTHSSFFIDVHRLDRIRFVVKDREKGSFIKEISITLDQIDQETFMPVMTAMACESKDGESQKNITNLNQIDSEVENAITYKEQVAIPRESISSEHEFSLSSESLDKTDAAFDHEPSLEEIKPKKSRFFGWFGKKKE